MARRHESGLACLLAIAAFCIGCTGGTVATQPPGPMPGMPANPNTVSPAFTSSNTTAQTGTTPGWFRGQTVTFFYHTNNFFCALPVADGQPVGSTSKCEVGSDGTMDPRPGMGKPKLFVMTPIGFRPDASTLHCPTVGQCINHPSTIDLSRLFGPTKANAPLPAHSHIIDAITGNWWELKVIGVKDLATWNQVVAGKSLATVRALQAADPTQTHITGDTFTNTYLFFEVRP